MKLKDRLVSLIKQKEWKAGAEIGVAKGGLFFHLLDSVSDLHMVGVDMWVPIIGQGQDTKQDGYRSYNDCNQEMRWMEVATKSIQPGYKSRSTILRMNSIEAAEYIKDESLDFVYIDADHRLSYVRADIAVWYPKVKPLGAMLGHDYNWLSVNKAVSNSFDNTAIDFGDNVWIKWKV